MRMRSLNEFVHLGTQRDRAVFISRYNFFPHCRDSEVHIVGKSLPSRSKIVANGQEFRFLTSFIVNELTRRCHPRDGKRIAPRGARWCAQSPIVVLLYQACIPPRSTWSTRTLPAGTHTIRVSRN